MEYSFNGSQIRIKALSSNITIDPTTSDLQVFNQIIASEELAFIKDLLPKESELKIVDVGANIGLSSIYLLNEFPFASLVAIEPNHRNFRLLEHNTISLRSRIETINAALWKSRSELAEVGDFRDGNYWSKRYTDSPSQTLGKVDGLVLGDLLDKTSGQIDYLKIDIEGGEAELFRDDRFIADLRNIRILSVEVHQEFISVAEVKSVLKKLGFVIFETGELLVALNTIAFNGNS
jgi:FkbM family methyltransferase